MPGGRPNCIVRASFIGRLLFYRNYIVQHLLNKDTDFFFMERLNTEIKIKTSCDNTVIKHSNGPNWLSSEPCTRIWEYDVANREATNLPPNRQISGSWTVAAAAPGAIHSMSYNSGNHSCTLYTHTHTHSQGRQRQSINPSNKGILSSAHPLWLDVGSSGVVGEGSTCTQITLSEGNTGTGRKYCL